MASVKYTSDDGEPPAKKTKGSDSSDDDPFVSKRKQARKPVTVEKSDDNSRDADGDQDDQGDQQKTSRPKREFNYEWPSQTMLDQCRANATFHGEVTVDQVYRRDPTLPQNSVDQDGKTYAYLCGDRTVNKDRHPLCNRCMYMRGWPPCTANNECRACDAMRGTSGAFHAWHTSNYRRGDGWPKCKGNVSKLKAGQVLTPMLAPTATQISKGQKNRKAARARQAKDVLENPLLAGSVIYHRRPESLISRTTFPAINPLFGITTVTTTMSSITVASTLSTASATVTTSTMPAPVKVSASRSATPTSSITTEPAAQTFLPGFKIPKVRQTARMSTSTSATRSSNIKRKTKPVPGTSKQPRSEWNFDNPKVSAAGEDLNAQAAAIQQQEDDRIAATNIPQPYAVVDMATLDAASGNLNVSLVDHQYIVSGDQVDPAFAFEAHVPDNNELFEPLDPLSTPTQSGSSTPKTRKAKKAKSNRSSPIRKSRKATRTAKSLAKAKRIAKEIGDDKLRRESSNISSEIDSDQYVSVFDRPVIPVLPTTSAVDTPKKPSSKQPKLVVSTASLTAPRGTVALSGISLHELIHSPRKNPFMMSDTRARVTGKVFSNLGEAARSTLSLEQELHDAQAVANTDYKIVGGTTEEVERWFHTRRGCELQRYDWYHYAYYLIKVAAKNLTVKPNSSVQKSSAFILANEFERNSISTLTLERKCWAMKYDRERRDQFMLSIPPRTPSMSTPDKSVLDDVDEMLAAEAKADSPAFLPFVTKRSRRKQCSPGKSPAHSGPATDEEKLVVIGTVTKPVVTVTTSTVTSSIDSHASDYSLSTTSADIATVVTAGNINVFSPASLQICTDMLTVPTSLTRIFGTAIPDASPTVTNVLKTPVVSTYVQTPSQTLKREASPTPDLVSALFDQTPGLISLAASEVDAVIATVTGMTATTATTKSPTSPQASDNEDPLLGSSATILSLQPDIDLFVSPAKPFDTTQSLNTPNVSVIGNVMQNVTPVTQTSTPTTTSAVRGTPTHPEPKSLSEITRKLLPSFDSGACGDGPIVVPTISTAVTTTEISVTTASISSVTTKSPTTVTTPLTTTIVSQPTTSAPSTSATKATDTATTSATIGESAAADYPRHDITFLAECLGFQDLMIPASTLPQLGHELTNAESDQNLSAPKTLNVTTDVQRIVAERIKRQQEHMQSELDAGRDFTTPIRPDDGLAQFALNYHSTMSALPVQAMQITEAMLPTGLNIDADSPFMAVAAECAHIEECSRVLLNINSMRSVFTAALAKSQLRGTYGESDQRAITRILALLNSDSTRVTSELLVFIVTMRRRSLARGSTNISDKDLLDFLTGPILYNPSL